MKNPIKKILKNYEIKYIATDHSRYSIIPLAKTIDICENDKTLIFGYRPHDPILDKIITTEETDVVKISSAVNLYYEAFADLKATTLDLSEAKVIHNYSELFEKCENVDNLIMPNDFIGKINNFRLSNFKTIKLGDNQRISDIPIIHTKLIIGPKLGQLDHFCEDRFEEDEEITLTHLADVEISPENKYFTKEEGYLVKTDENNERTIVASTDNVGEHFPENCIAGYYSILDQTLSCVHTSDFKDIKPTAFHKCHIKKLYVDSKLSNPIYAFHECIIDELIIGRDASFNGVTPFYECDIHHFDTEKTELQNIFMRCKFGDDKDTSEFVLPASLTKLNEDVFKGCVFPYGIDFNNVNTFNTNSVFTTKVKKLHFRKHVNIEGTQILTDEIKKTSLIFEKGFLGKPITNCSVFVNIPLEKFLHENKYCTKTDLLNLDYHFVEPITLDNLLSQGKTISEINQILREENDDMDR